MPIVTRADVGGLVVCSCSWSGRLAAKALCPQCGKHQRVTKSRGAVLCQLAEGRNPVIQAIQRTWLRRAELAKPAEPPRAPTGKRRFRVSPRHYKLTEMGWRVVEVIRSHYPTATPVLPDDLGQQDVS